MRSKKYGSLKSGMKSLDVFLFSGEGKFSSLIQCCTQTQYSHIGIVITGGDLIKIGVKVPDQYRDKDGLYLFHSNKGSIGDLVDIASGEEKSGAQINSLGEVVSRYKGKIFYRQLERNGSSIDYQKLMKSVKNLLPQEYETNYCQLFCAVLPCLLMDEDTSKLFCSELVAQVFIDQGALSKNIPSDNYIPSDFSSEFEHVRFTNRWQLGKEFKVIPPSP
jgi:hypothetical protein